MTIMFSKVTPVGSEMQHIQDVIQSGKLSGNGKYTALCEQFLEEYYGCKVLLVTSCTHALEMAALLIDVKPNDEIIMPSFTFVSTANAFILRGAKIVFVDVDSNGNMNLEALKMKISSKTRAVVNVHYAGWSCVPEQLKQICNDNNVLLIEDAAQSLGSRYKESPLGTLGELSTISFHDTKNIVAGEGGALLIRNQKYLERAYYLREKGTNRKQFHQGLVDKYTWVSMGSSYEMPELSAAFLYGQLNGMDKIISRRKEIWDFYYQSLNTIDKVRILRPIEDLNGNAHLFGIVFESESIRNQFIAFMKVKGIVTPFHYIPLHSSPFFCNSITQTQAESEFVNTNHISSCLVRLPLHYGLTDEEVSYVVDCTLEFIGDQL